MDERSIFEVFIFFSAFLNFSLTPERAETKNLTPNSPSPQRRGVRGEVISPFDLWIVRLDP